MLTYQPFYIKGVEDINLARDNAFGAMIFFIVLFVTSLFHLQYVNRIKSGEFSQTVMESEEDDQRFLIPRGMSDYEVENSKGFDYIEQNLRRRNTSGMRSAGSASSSSMVELPTLS